MPKRKRPDKQKFIRQMQRALKKSKHKGPTAKKKHFLKLFRMVPRLVGKKRKMVKVPLWSFRMPLTRKKRLSLGKQKADKYERFHQDFLKEEKKWNKLHPDEDSAGRKKKKTAHFEPNVALPTGYNSPASNVDKTINQSSTNFRKDNTMSLQSRLAEYEKTSGKKPKAGIVIKTQKDDPSIQHPKGLTMFKPDGSTITIDADPAPEVFIDGFDGKYNEKTILDPKKILKALTGLPCPPKDKKTLITRFLALKKEYEAMNKKKKGKPKKANIEVIAGKPGKIKEQSEDPSVQHVLGFIFYQGDNSFTVDADPKLEIFVNGWGHKEETLMGKKAMAFLKDMRKLKLAAGDIKKVKAKIKALVNSLSPGRNKKKSKIQDKSRKKAVQKIKKEKV